VIDSRSILFYLIFCELLTILCSFRYSFLYSLTNRVFFFLYSPDMSLKLSFRRSFESGLCSLWSAGSGIKQRLVIEPKFFVSSLKHMHITFCSIGSVCMEKRRHCPQGKKRSRNVSNWLKDRLTNWLTDSLTHSLTHWLTHWLTDSLTDWLTDWLTDSLTHWLTDWLPESLIHWLTHWLIYWLFPICSVQTFRGCLLSTMPQRANWWKMRHIHRYCYYYT